jgi:hypothetical protein
MTHILKFVVFGFLMKAFAYFFSCLCFNFRSYSMGMCGSLFIY